MRREGLYYVEHSLFYLILFFIIREWLIPVVELTETGQLGLLLVFVAICCVINVFEIHFLFSAAIKVIFISWFLVHVYTDFSLWSAEGISFLWRDMWMNIGVVLNGQFEQVTNPFRSLLFFLLMWMFIYLLDYWLKVRMTIFYFFVMTVFFIATLDTFTAYDGTFAVVKVVLLGLVMTVLLYMKRLVVQTGTEVSPVKYVRYVLPVLLAIMAAGFVAVLLPKAEPQWPDPVPYIKSLNDSSGGPPGQSTAKVGFGDDDSQLGGAFEADDTVVFNVHADTKQYWRVETKDYYTTKGWESSTPPDTRWEIEEGSISLSILPNLEEEERVAKVFSTSGRNYMLQPYGLASYEFEEEDIGLFVQEGTERLSTYTIPQEEEYPLAQYNVNYSSPSYSYTQLKQVTDTGVRSVSGSYLQLPPNLPQRVIDLSLEITEGKVSTYDKAREIEQYFRKSGFWYDTENVAVPTDDQDYVDQFLFETKRGYCDNFSTSMVVMLRANNIPARWVKGFAGGSEVGLTDDGQRIFEVENNDAHSWVEAYIEGIGWMTFEPTIGFSAPSQIDYDLDAAEEEATPEELEQQEQDRMIREEVETEVAKKSAERSFMWLYVLLAIMAVVSIVAFMRRRKWMPKVHIANQRRKADHKEAVQSAYKVLLKQLEREGLVRGRDETLAKFAIRVDGYFGTLDMSKVTDVYEKSIYSKNADDFSFDKIQESWEYLINATADS